MYNIFQRWVWQRCFSAFLLHGKPLPHFFIPLCPSPLFSHQTVFTRPLTSTNFSPVFLSALHLFLSLDVFSGLSSMQREPETDRGQVKENNVRFVRLRDFSHLLVKRNYPLLIVTDEKLCLNPINQTCFLYSAFQNKATVFINQKF